MSSSYGNYDFALAAIAESVAQNMISHRPYSQWLETELLALSDDSAMGQTADQCDAGIEFWGTEDDTPWRVQLDRNG